MTTPTSLKGIHDKIDAAFLAAGEPDHSVGDFQAQLQLNILFTAVDSLIDDIPESGLRLDDAQQGRAEILLGILDTHGPLKAIEACLSYAVRRDGVVGSSAASGPSPDPGAGGGGDLPAGDPEDPAPVVYCEDFQVRVLWFRYWHCLTMPACVWHFLSVDRNWFNFGMCLTTGTAVEPDDDVCDCREAGIPLEVLMVLISLATIWAGGPVFSTIGRTVLQRILARSAAAGIG